MTSSGEHCNSTGRIAGSSHQGPHQQHGTRGLCTASAEGLQAPCFKRGGEVCSLQSCSEVGIYSQQNESLPVITAQRPMSDLASSMGQRRYRQFGNMNNWINENILAYYQSQQLW